MEKIYSCSDDIYCLGLLYVYQYSNKEQMIVTLEDLRNFFETIKINLEKMNCEIVASGWNDSEEPIYFTSLDESGNLYYGLKPDFDLEQAKLKYIGTVPINCIIASQMPNALDCLGLIKIENKIFSKLDLNNGVHSDCNVLFEPEEDRILKKIKNRVK